MWSVQSDDDVVMRLVNGLCVLWLDHELECLMPSLRDVLEEVTAVKGCRTAAEREEIEKIERGHYADLRSGTPKGPLSRISPSEAAAEWIVMESEYLEGDIDEAGPSCGGVYGLYAEDGTLLYVGKAKSAAGRLKTHANDFLKRQAGWSTWRVWPVDGEGARRSIEAHVIQALSPALNVAGRAK